MKARKGTPAPPRAADSFTEYVLDPLRDLGPVEARRLFGGRGLYWKDLIFGLVDEGRVYFRVSAETVARYAAEGSKPFEPMPGYLMKGYYEVPAWSLPRTGKRKARS